MDHIWRQDNTTVASGESSEEETRGHHKRHESHSPLKEVNAKLTFLLKEELKERIASPRVNSFWKDDPSPKELLESFRKGLKSNGATVNSSKAGINSVGAGVSRPMALLSRTTDDEVPSPAKAYWRRNRAWRRDMMEWQDLGAKGSSSRRRRSPQSEGAIPLMRELDAEELETATPSPKQQDGGVPDGEKSATPLLKELEENDSERGKLAATVTKALDEDAQEQGKAATPLMEEGTQEATQACTSSAAPGRGCIPLPSTCPLPLLKFLGSAPTGISHSSESTPSSLGLSHTAAQTALPSVRSVTEDNCADSDETFFHSPPPPGLPSIEEQSPRVLAAELWSSRRKGHLSRRDMGTRSLNAEGGQRRRTYQRSTGGRSFPLPGTPRGRQQALLPSSAEGGAAEPALSSGTRQGTEENDESQKTPLDETRKPNTGLPGEDCGAPKSHTRSEPRCLNSRVRRATLRGDKLHATVGSIPSNKCGKGLSSSVHDLIEVSGEVTKLEGHACVRRRCTMAAPACSSASKQPQARAQRVCGSSVADSTGAEAMIHRLSRAEPLPAAGIPGLVRRVSLPMAAPKTQGPTCALARMRADDKQLGASRSQKFAKPSHIAEILDAEVDKLWPPEPEWTRFGKEGAQATGGGWISSDGEHSASDIQCDHEMELQLQSSISPVVVGS